MMKRLLFIVSLLLFNVSCCKDDVHRVITIVNESDISIYVNASITDKGVPGSFWDYLYGSGPAIYVGDRIPILPGTSNRDILRFERCTSSFEARLRDEMLRIFFLDADVYETVPWETIVENNMILECRFWTLDDLIRDDWKVYYPARE